MVPEDENGVYLIGHSKKKKNFFNATIQEILSFLWWAFLSADVDNVKVDVMKLRGCPFFMGLPTGYLHATIPEGETFAPTIGKTCFFIGKRRHMRVQITLSLPLLPAGLKLWTSLLRMRLIDTYVGMVNISDFLKISKLKEWNLKWSSLIEDLNHSKLTPFRI